MSEEKFSHNSSKTKAIAQFCIDQKWETNEILCYLQLFCAFQFAGNEARKEDYKKYMNHVRDITLKQWTEIKSNAFKVPYGEK